MRKLKSMKSTYMEILVGQKIHHTIENIELVYFRDGYSFRATARPEVIGFS